MLFKCFEFRIVIQLHVFLMFFVCWRVHGVNLDEYELFLLLFADYVVGGVSTRMKVVVLKSLSLFILQVWSIEEKTKRERHDVTTEWEPKIEDKSNTAMEEKWLMDGVRERTK